MSDDTDSADRPASVESEIEVTPEMIEAGLRAIESCSIDGDFGSSIAVRRELAILVFRSMASRSIGLHQIPAEVHQTA
jgi:hypothetical protein